MHSTHAPIQSRRARVRAAAALLVAGAGLCLAACLGPAGGSTEAEGIRLQGRVIGTGGAPVAGVVVSASRAGLLDTTDALGRYILSDENPDDLPEGVVLDTLRFAKNGQSLAKVHVTSWIEEFPDVEVIQRNISGALHVGLLPMGRIEFVLRGDGIDSLDPVVTQIYYNALAENYSGFAYFPPSSTVRNYSVYINVYGPGGGLLARSQTVPFNSFAGDIVLPEFPATNAFPVAQAGRDTALPVQSVLALHGAASDAFGGTVVKREWSLGGGGFAERALDTTFVLPAVRNPSYRCVLRVTDDDGNVTLDTMFVAVTNDDPALTVQADTAVKAGATVTLTASATDAQGVARYIWDFDADGTPDDTTATGSIARAFPATSALHRVVVRAQDPYDGESRDTIAVFAANAGLQWTARTSGTTATLTSVTWTGTQFVAVGILGTVLTSPDGLTWTPRPLANTVNLNDVVWNGRTLLAIVNGSTSPTMAYASTDGSTWTSIRPMGVMLSGGLIGSAADSLIFMTSISSGRLFYMTPDGGSTWFADTLGGLPPNGLLRFVKHAGRYVGVGNSGVAGHSLDGLAWTRNTQTFTPGPGGLYDFTMMGLTSTGTYAVAVGLAGNVMRSTDGMTWQHPRPAAGIVQPTTGSNAGDLYGVVWTGSDLVAVGNGYTILSTDQGATWIRVGDANLRSVAWNGTRLVAVGGSGVILTSE